MGTPTPDCVPAVSPVQWIHAFAYTPESTRVRKHRYRHPELAIAELDRVPQSEDDVLPTQFSAAGRALLPGRDPVRPPGESLDAYGLSDSSFTDRDKVVLSPSTTPDGPTKRPTRKARSRTRLTMGGNGHNRDLPPSHAVATSTRPWSHRVALDAAEIVSQKRSPGRMTQPRATRARCLIENAHKEASSCYPSPPVSRTDRDVAVHDGHSSSHISHSVIVSDEGRASATSALPLKVSKYFARASDPATSSVPTRLRALTPPRSPTLDLAAYIESSDVKYSWSGASSGEAMEDIVEESSAPLWYNDLGLLEDLIIMLRRLKPILVQESVRDDPWKVLIAARLLNVTTGKAAIPVFCKIISCWPTPQDLVRAPPSELVELLRPLGLYNKRASWLKEMSQYFLEDRWAADHSGASLASLVSEKRITPTAPHLHCPGIGAYALDSLRVFCAADEDTWKQVMPQDKELVRYLRWRWAVEERKVWYPGGRGVIGEVDVPYLITLVDELAAHYDRTIGGEGYIYHFCNDLLQPIAAGVAARLRPI